MHVKSFFVPRRYSMTTRDQVTSATRARLITATVDVLADVGVDLLTMQAVAERADVALRTVYNHFPSKEALVVEAYDRVAGTVQDAVATVPTIGSPRVRLGQFVDAVLLAFERESPGTAAIMRASGIAEFDAHVRRIRTWRRQELTTLLRPASRSGDLRVPLKEAVALAFVWTAFATFNSLVDESGLSPVVARRLARDTLDAALFGPGG